MKPEPKPMEIAALHRYFLNASSMKSLFHQHIRDNGAVGMDSDLWPQQWIYQSLWYGTLFVVSEGWNELGLRDAMVDELRAAPNHDLLRRFRNGMFHFQRDYHDDRFVGLIVRGDDSAAWIESFHSAIGNAILMRMRQLIES